MTFKLRTLESVLADPLVVEDNHGILSYKDKATLLPKEMRVLLGTSFEYNPEIKTCSLVLILNPARLTGVSDIGGTTWAVAHWMLDKPSQTLLEHLELKQKFRESR